MPYHSVVIVEDDILLGQGLAKCFNAAGLPTLLVSDGNRALNHISKVMPELVILDIHLPHISGEEILQKIRATHSIAATKVLLVSADALRAKGMEHKADMILLKPVSFLQVRDLGLRLAQI